MEGYATVVTPDNLTVFDKKKNREIEIATAKDYTSLVGIGAPVTVWYTTEGGVNHLEDMVYPAGGSFVPSNLIGENIKRIIVLPRVEGVENSQGLMSAISAYLADNAGWYVAPPELAEEIVQRNKGSMSSLDAIDPDTGNVDMQRYLQAQSSLVTAIANETRSDAVLEVKLMKVRAKVRTSIASWDDMTEPVASKKTRFLSPVGGLGGEGWAYAATADMALWNKNGMLLWKKRRGFALLAVQSGMGVKYHERPLTEVYANRGAMQRWLDATLAQLTPSHRGTTAGPSALSPEIQEQIDKAKRAGEKPE